jgi:uncharacterized membrane protein YfcA
MRIPVLLWGMGMALLGAIGVVAFDFDSPLEPILLFGIAGFMVLLGIVMLAGRRRAQRDDLPVRALPDASPATAWMGTGLVLVVLGAALGKWLVLIGAGAVAVGLAGVVRETRAERRAAREAAARPEARPRAVREEEPS